MSSSYCCALIRKKRGHQPTGILSTTAKATGYSSVSEMLLKGGGISNQENVEPVMTGSPKKVSLTYLFKFDVILSLHALEITTLFSELDFLKLCF